MVVIGIFVLIATITVSILIVILRGTKNSDSIILVRQNGEYAMAQIVRMVRFAKSLDDPVTCDSTPLKSITITTFDLNQTTFSCPDDPLPTPNFIASNSANSTKLTNMQSVGVSSCSFVCTQSGTGPPLINIKFILLKVNSNGLPEGDVTIPFQSSVTMRNLGGAVDQQFYIRNIFCCNKGEKVYFGVIQSYIKKLTMQKSQSIRLLTDQAVFENIKKGNSREDALDFVIYADVIKKVILGTDGPFTIGIFGEWGTGKTSLIRIIENHFDESSEIIPIWFNAWKFENVEHPIVPLIATIVTELEKNKSKLKKLKDSGKSLIRSLRAIAYGFSTNTKLNIPGFAEIEAGFVAKDMIEREEKLSFDPLLEKSLYHQAFEMLDNVSLKYGKNILKILVLIDDLDRCFPENSVKLLESIKLVLSQPGFLFVLGVSRKVIDDYLRNKYEKEYGIKEFQGNAYLDKIIQLPFDIPSYASRTQTFAEKMINELESEDDKIQLRQISTEMGKLCNDNPRTIIRFINTLLLDKAIYAAFHPNEEDMPIAYFAFTRTLREINDTSLLEMLKEDAGNDPAKTIFEWIRKKGQNNDR